MTIVEVLKLSADYLRKHDADSPRLDAELLLAHALGIGRLDLYLKFDRVLAEAELTTYRGLVARRAKGDERRLARAARPSLLGSAHLDRK